MPQLRLNLGRSRVTSAASPSEAGYIRSIQRQAEMIEANLMKVTTFIKDITPEAIIFGLQPIFDLSQEYVPVDTGKLKRSGFLRVDKEGRSGTIRVLMGYGRFGIPHYAGFVHERVDIAHAKGKRAKFLESAINERIHIFKARIVQYYQDAGLK